MMKNEPLVSCIIPTYNREKFLPNSIGSVLKQTYKNWELIIVDDRSTDESKKLIEEYMKKDKRIKYVKNKHNNGCYGARNQGVELVKGEYIAFLDSDDEWMSFHLSEMIEEMQKNPDVDWIYSFGKKIKNNKIVLKSSYPNSNEAKNKFKIEKRDKLFVLKKNQLTNVLNFEISSGIQKSILRKRIFNKINFDENFFAVADRLLPIEAIYHNFKFAYLTNVHLKYNIHEDNLSNCNPTKDINKKLRINKQLEKLYLTIPKKIRLNKSQKKIIDKKLANLYFWNIGYNHYIIIKDYKNAKKYFLKGLKLNTFDWKYWKTYIKNIILN
jgi:glycosyltransferase involved in cell wall biosynthesis